MALKLSGDAQTMIFQMVFGLTSMVTVKAKTLVAAGVTFEVELYSIKSTYKGKVTNIGLTAGTTALMKNTVDAPVMAQNKKLIEDWIDGLVKEVNPVVVSTDKLTAFVVPSVIQPNLIVVIKAIRGVTGLGLGEAKQLAEKMLAGSPITLTLVASKASATMILKNAGVSVEGEASTYNPIYQKTDAAKKPLSKVIHLKDAEALGQQVHGTSSGSIYHTIAIGEHVKIAARLYKGGSISIRAEWNGTPQEDLQKLAAAGVGMKGNYGSIHFDAAQVPLSRVIGAFLVGTEIPWKAAVMNGADLVVGENKY